MIEYCYVMYEGLSCKTCGMTCFRVEILIPVSVSGRRGGGEQGRRPLASPSVDVISDDEGRGKVQELILRPSESVEDGVVQDTRQRSLLQGRQRIRRDSLLLRAAH